MQRGRGESGGDGARKITIEADRDGREEARSREVRQEKVSRAPEAGGRGHDDGAGCRSREESMSITMKVKRKR